MDIPNEIKLFPGRVESGMFKRCFLWILLPFVALLSLSLIWGAALYIYQSGRDRFAAGDFIDAPALSEKILNSTNGVSFFVKERLSGETLAALKNLRTWSSNNARTYQMLAADLERIANTNVALFDSSDIKTTELGANVSLRVETRRMLYSRIAPNEMAKLNRMLLEDAYSDEIIPKMTWWKCLLYSVKLWFQWYWPVYVGGAALMLAAFFFLRIQKDLGATLRAMVLSGALQPLNRADSMS